MTRWWLLLAAAIAADVAATMLLEASHGFARRLPALLAIGAFGLTVYLYGVAITRLPVATAYAVFGAVGTAVTAVVAIRLGLQPANWATYLGLALILGGVIVLPLA